MTHRHDMRRRRFGYSAHPTGAAGAASTGKNTFVILFLQLISIYHSSLILLCSALERINADSALF